MTVRPIARAINKPLHIFGLPRRLFGLIGLASGVLYEVLASRVDGPLVMIVPGLLFGGLYYGAKKLARQDDQIFEVALCAFGMRDAYDPFKRALFHIEIVEVPEEDL